MVQISLYITSSKEFSSHKKNQHNTARKYWTKQDKNSIL